MKYAVMSDIHSNYTAFKACYEKVLENKVDGFIFLGDYITDSSEPQKVMELVYKIRDRFECYFIRGNREDYVINYRLGKEKWSKSSQNGSLLYAYENLSEEDIDFFESLPIYKEIELSNKFTIGICHGSPLSSGDMIKVQTVEDWIDKINTDFLFCGHVHRPMVFTKSNKTIVNVGSVGMQVDGNLNARMTILSIDDGDVSFKQLEIPYDINSEVDRIDKSKLGDYGKIWTRNVKKTLLTAENYIMFCLLRAKELAVENNFDVSNNPIPEKYWEQAAKELNI